jgi:hypothetical protein
MIKKPIGLSTLALKIFVGNMLDCRGTCQRHVLHDLEMFFPRRSRGGVTVQASGQLMGSHLTI